MGSDVRKILPGNDPDGMCDIPDHAGYQPALPRCPLGQMIIPDPGSDFRDLLQRSRNGEIQIGPEFFRAIGIEAGIG